MKLFSLILVLSSTYTWASPKIFCNGQTSTDSVTITGTTVSGSFKKTPFSFTAQGKFNQKFNQMTWENKASKKLVRLVIPGAYDSASEAIWGQVVSHGEARPLLCSWEE